MELNETTFELLRDLALMQRLSVDATCIELYYQGDDKGEVLDKATKDLSAVIPQLAGRVSRDPVVTKLLIGTLIQMLSFSITHGLDTMSSVEKGIALDRLPILEMIIFKAFDGNTSMSLSAIEDMKTWKK